MKERLHKILAAAGIASRRTCEQYILEGRVRIDGVLIKRLGTKVDPEDCEIRFDGKPIRRETRIAFLVNKPKGFVCTNASDEQRPRVIDLFGKIHRRLYTAGRLDADSSGLLIVTNNGDLTNQITHPRFHIPKTYQVRCRGRVDKETLHKIRQGVWLSEGKTSPAKIRRVSGNANHTRLEVTLFEGRNRQIRRMFARHGHNIIELRRIRIGRLSTRKLPMGRFRQLSNDEINTLLRQTRPRRNPS